MDLEFDLIDEDSVANEAPADAEHANASAKTPKPPKPPKPPPRKNTAEPISVDFTSDDEIFARDTAIPSLPPEEFAAASMRSADLSSTIANQNTQPPPARLSDAPPSGELEFEDFGHAMDIFGQSLPGAQGTARAEQAEPSPETPRFLASSAPTAPPAGPVPDFDANAPLDDTTRNPVFVEDGLREMAEIPDSIKDGSPLGFVDSHSRFANSLSPVAGLEEPSFDEPPEPVACAQDMQEAFDLGDFTRALEIAESLLEKEPAHASALRLAQESRDVLTQMLAARVGPLDQVMKLKVSPEELQWLALDHRAGFLLSMVDGMSTVDEILDVSGMTRHDALKLILDLIKQQVVELS